MRTPREQAWGHFASNDHKTLSESVDKACQEKAEKGMVIKQVDHSITVLPEPHLDMEHKIFYSVYIIWEKA